MKIFQLLFCVMCLLSVSACQTQDVSQRKPLKMRVDWNHGPIKWQKSVFFDFDSAAITLTLDNKKALDEAVRAVEQIDLEVLIVVGYTDSLGSTAYNKALSLRRATAVKTYLASKGVNPKRIYTEGWGARNPVAGNDTARGRAKNRRVEIDVVGPTKAPYAHAAPSGLTAP